MSNSLTVETAKQIMYLRGYFKDFSRIPHWNDSMKLYVYRNVQFSIRGLGCSGDSIRWELEKRMDPK